MQGFIENPILSFSGLDMGTIGGEGHFRAASERSLPDRTLNRVTHGGHSQEGDHHCVLGQKQWVTLGPKYRQCGCHLGKRVPGVGWVGGSLRKSSGSWLCSGPLLCSSCSLKSVIHVLTSCLPSEPASAHRLVHFPISSLPVSTTSSSPPKGP